MKVQLKNLVSVAGKPIFIEATADTEKAREAGRKAGKRFFNTFATKRK